MEFAALGLIVLFPVSVWYAVRRLRADAGERRWWAVVAALSVAAFFVGLVGLRGQGDVWRGLLWTVAVFTDLTIATALIRRLRERGGAGLVLG